MWDKRGGSKERRGGELGKLEAKGSVQRIYVDPHLAVRTSLEGRGSAGGSFQPTGHRRRSINVWY